MKNLGWLLFLVLYFAGCDKAINIMPPAILVENSTPSASDTIEIKVVEFADIDGQEIKADYYKWLITDSDEKTIASGFPDSSVIYWTPNLSGYFLIKVTIGYDGNKSITAIREISVTESTGTLSKKLAGHWKGIGKRGYDGAEWGIDLDIDSNYSYTGTADFYGLDPGCDKGVFNIGGIYYFEEPTINQGSLFDSCTVAPNLECQKIVLLEVKENKGSGKIWISGGEIIKNYSNTLACFEQDFKNLNFSNNNETLNFEIPPYWDPNGTPATIILHRQ
jgi:hypothetical protein